MDAYKDASLKVLRKGERASAVENAQVYEQRSNSREGRYGMTS